MAEGTTYHFRVNAETAGGRLDQLIPRFIVDLSRSRGQALIGSGLVTVNDAAVTKHYAVRQGDLVQVTLPPPLPATPQPEQIPIQILHEEQDFVAVNKPAGMVVHPAPGHPGGTLVNALLAALPNLSGIGGVLRPGIVHRLDKGTSGVVLVAKNDRAHRALAAQFAGRKVEKTYLALAWGTLEENEGRWDAAIGRDRKDRQKISVRSRRPRAAVTRWSVLRRLPDSTLVEVHPETGRTHQIRVHLANASHPVLGDTTYAPRGGRESSYHRASIRHGFRDRLALHAWKIRFTPPGRRTPVEITAPLPEQLQALLPELTAGRSAPRGTDGPAKGWRAGEVSSARTAGSTVEVRSDRTPKPKRKTTKSAR